MKAISTITEKNPCSRFYGLAWQSIFPGEMTKIDIKIRFNEDLLYLVSIHVLYRCVCCIGMFVLKQLSKPRSFYRIEANLKWSWLLATHLHPRKIFGTTDKVGKG